MGAAEPVNQVPEGSMTDTKNEARFSDLRGKSEAFLDFCVKSIEIPQKYLRDYKLSKAKVSRIRKKMVLEKKVSPFAKHVHIHVTSGRGGELIPGSDCLGELGEALTFELFAANPLYSEKLRSLVLEELISGRGITHDQRTMLEWTDSKVGICMYEAVLKMIETVDLEVRMEGTD